MTLDHIHRSGWFPRFLLPCSRNLEMTSLCSSLSHILWIHLHILSAFQGDLQQLCLQVVVLSNTHVQAFYAKAHLVLPSCVHLCLDKGRLIPSSMFPFWCIVFGWWVEISFWLSDSTLCFSFPLLHLSSITILLLFLSLVRSLMYEAKLFFGQSICRVWCCCLSPRPFAWLRVQTVSC